MLLALLSIMGCASNPSKKPNLLCYTICKEVNPEINKIEVMKNKKTIEAEPICY